MLRAVDLRAEVFVDEYNGVSVTMAGLGSAAANPCGGIEQ